ncbi:RidA family protein [Leucobacter soli]|uniref:RidA family protein n=1 Tax=Leucobacter soli TaxID=2812850 RepID=UPI00361D87AF
MTNSVEWLPIPGKEHLDLPLSMGAAHGSLLVMTQIPQQEDGTLNLGSAEEQTRQVMRNFQVELEKAGSSLSQVLTITIYVADVADAPAVAKVWGEFYPGRGPGRATLGVAFPTPGLKVEMTAFAIRG